MPTWRDMRGLGDIRGEHDLRSVRSHAIQSQYSASARLLGLAAAFQDRLDPTADHDVFYKRMFDILTAEGEGLDNWGRLVSIRRTIMLEDGSVMVLGDEPYRLLLLYKALANISASDPASLNRLLAELCSTGVGGLPTRAYVLEVAPMVIRWVFEAPLGPEQLAVFRAAGTLARGGGVGWELYAIGPEHTFGFDGQLLQPFNQAPFVGDNALVINRE
jgi:hypothetical protein